MTRYLKVRWNHDLADEPIWLYHEVSEGLETRKVEVYADGRMDFADAEASTGSTRLGDSLMPTIEELADDPEFTPADIDRAEFEDIWSAATKTR